jgi:uroporphyrinogen-III synthase
MRRMEKTTRRPRARLSAGPLAGATLVVTRPTGSAQSLKRRIRALAGSALGVPGMTLRSTADPAQAKSALAAARDADCVIFVSPAAVKYAFALRPGLRFARSTSICAVGAATARALLRHGLRTVSWPRERQDSEGLLALPELAHLRGKHVILIGAPGGRELLAQTLRARRARVARIHVYERAAPRYSRRHFAALEQASPPLVTLVSSAEVLANLRAVLPLDLFARLAAGDLVASSERLAVAARESLFTNVHVAASASPRDLVAAAVAALARHRL